MTARSFAIPDKVRRNAQEQGVAGRAWLAGLPQQIAEIERDWAITIGDMTQNATEAFVAFARLADGGDAVLKIVMPGFDANRQELRVLRAANGKGYAKLLRADETRNVMLLERLGRQLHVLNLPDERKMAVITTSIRPGYQARPVRRSQRARRRRSNSPALSDTLAQRSENPVRRPFDALEFARQRRAASVSKSVQIHGDAHSGTRLQATDGSFKLWIPMAPSPSAP
jgi:streptomycin 6-kinase